MIAGKRILIAGGAGFLGSHVAALLASRNRVTVIDDLSTGRTENLRGISCRFVRAKAWGPAARRLLRRGGFDFVLQLAANAYIKTSVEQPAMDFDRNLAQTVALLETVRRLNSRPKVLFASSAAVHGSTIRFPMREKDPVHPVSPYGVSKIASEFYCEVYHRLYGIPALSVRFFPMFGPRQRKQVIYDLLCKLHSQAKTVNVHGSGRERRDFTFVEDAAAAVVHILNRFPFEGRAVNLCSGKGVSIRRVAEALVRATGSRKKLRFTGILRPGDVQKMVGSNELLKRSGFRARVGFEEGIQRTVDWFVRESRIR